MRLFRFAMFSLAISLTSILSAANAPPEAASRVSLVPSEAPQLRAHDLRTLVFRKGQHSSKRRIHPHTLGAIQCSHDSMCEQVEEIECRVTWANRWPWQCNITKPTMLALTGTDYVVDCEAVSLFSDVIWRDSC